MKLSIQRKQLYSFFEYLFVITLILDCRTLWQRLNTTPPWFNIAIWIFLIMSVVGCILTKRRVYAETAKKAMLCIAISLLYISFFVLFRPFNISNFLKLGLATCAIAVYFIICYDEESDALNRYTNIISIVAAVSIFFWLFGSVLKIIPSTGIVVTNWETVFSPNVPSYFNVYYSTQRAEFFGGYLSRNTAIFTEAPMASFHFSIAFLFEFFIKRKPTKWKLIVLITAICTTLSFTGYIIIAIAVFLKYLIRKENKNVILFVLKFIGVPLLMLLCSGIIIYFMSVRMQTASGISRLRDFTEGFDFWSNEIMFGYGYKSEKVATVGFSNSIIPVLTQGGLYIALFYVGTMGTGIAKLILHRKKQMLCFVLIFLILFTITNIAYQYFTLFLFLYICNYNVNIEKRKEQLTLYDNLLNMNIDKIMSM